MSSTWHLSIEWLTVRLLVEPLQYVFRCPNISLPRTISLRAKTFGFPEVLTWNKHCGMFARKPLWIGTAKCSSSSSVSSRFPTWRSSHSEIGRSQHFPVYYAQYMKFWKACVRNKTAYWLMNIVPCYFTAWEKKSLTNFFLSFQRSQR